MSFTCITVNRHSQDTNVKFLIHDLFNSNDARSSCCNMCVGLKKEMKCLVRPSRRRCREAARAPGVSTPARLHLDWLLSPERSQFSPSVAAPLSSCSSSSSRSTKVNPSATQPGWTQPRLPSLRFPTGLGENTLMLFTSLRVCLRSP